MIQFDRVGIDSAGDTLFSSLLASAAVFVFRRYTSAFASVHCSAPYGICIEIIFTITGTTSKGISLFSAISILSDGTKGFTLHRLVNAYLSGNKSTTLGTFSRSSITLRIIHTHICFTTAYNLVLCYTVIVIIIIAVIIIGQSCCPLVRRRPEHAASMLACIALSSARSCPTGICPGLLPTAWLVSVVICSCLLSQSSDM